MEAEDFTLKCNFWWVYGFRNSRRRQVSKLFLANIYPVYRAVKLVAVVFK